MLSDGWTCIHRDQGLCPSCQEEFDEDPAAWFEFGQHTQGIANWEALRAEIEAWRPIIEPSLDCVSLDDIPF